MKYFAAPKVPKDVQKEMNALQRALYKRAQDRGSQGCDVLVLLGAGKPFVNEFGNKEFANSAKIRKDIAVLVTHRVLVRKGM